MQRYAAGLCSVILGLTLIPEPAVAAPSVLCIRESNGAVVIRPRRCRGGETRVSGTSALIGTPGADGADGAPGTPGEDGQLRIYGDGSGGAITVGSGENSTAYLDVGVDGHLQFTDVTIAAGGVLDVPSGSVIRCTGTFTNNGTINVVPVQSNGGVGWFMSSTGGSFSLPASGPSGHRASVGELGDETQIRSGGLGGSGITDTETLNLFRPSLHGGGAGAGAISALGASGGGSLTILAHGGIVIGATGEIVANGDDGIDGAGGGAGGIIILASPASIANSGTIEAQGGDGGASTEDSAPGGGGGGGIVRLISPEVTQGSIDVAGGAGGTVSGAVMISQRHSGGGGGGAGGGSGGSGGSTSQASPPIASAGITGAQGYGLVTRTDPTALF